MGVTQVSISKLEKRNDLLISSLSKYIDALGGELDLIARFPEGDFHITFDKEKIE